MARHIAVIGFGEAAQAFAGAVGWCARVYDKLTDEPGGRAQKLADYAAFAVDGCDTLGEALEGADLVISLVTAGEALFAAKAAARHIGQGALYCDLNSVSPETKKAAAKAIAEKGGRYVDVAIMAPVNPSRLGVPLLISGSAGKEVEQRFRAFGFEKLRRVGETVGDASAIKMIRSVIVKGIEALTAEAILAADAAGVTDEVLSSLEESERPMSWSERVNHNLDRMIIHGTRRSDEMAEAVRTLESLGVDPLLTRGTVIRQREIGALGLRSKPGLEAKIAQLRARKAAAA